jgi:hypothetical protein
LHGLDPATGKTVWKVEQKECFGSPVRITLDGIEAAAMPKGDIVRANDGKKLAVGASKNYYQSAVVHGDTIYSMRHDAFSDEDGSELMTAVKVQKAAGGEYEYETDKLWETKIPSGYASPLYFDGLLYNSKNNVGLIAFDAATGKSVFTKRFNGLGENYPSMAQAGGMLFISGQSGKTFVGQAGRKFQELAANPLCEEGDQLVGAPFFEGECIYFRTHQFLFCFGRPPTK